MISARTKIIAVIGDPIEHSLSPRIQNAALNEISADIRNVAFRVAPDNLERAIRGAQSLGLLGLMVTIPHKEAVLSLCDELDNSARAMGAANLLHFRSDGKIIGYSSDGWAAIESLREENVSLERARIAIIGGGGAARSLALSMALSGAREITLFNRTLERAERLSDEVNALIAASPHKVLCLAHALPLDESTLRRELPNANILIHATSIGMHPNIDETPIARELLHPNLTVYDIVYNPLETRLLREAREIGARAVDGLGMLIHTNVRAVQVCAGLEISPRTMREEALRAFGLEK